jgi:glucose-6-phosphate 1-dehydrogenase
VPFLLRSGKRLARDAERITLVQRNASNIVIDIADRDVKMLPYEQLIRDVIEGDHSRFVTAEGLRHAWRVVAPVLENRPDPFPYEPGSMGPGEAGALAEPHGWLLTN